MFTHVKPTLSAGSLSVEDAETGDYRPPVSTTANKPLMGSVERSTLLIPAVVVVPSISGVSQQS
jgi:hypothetical protein